ncbi:MAG: hypothetical protein AABW79_01075 [Nanoarchaeota archaeon]
MKKWKGSVIEESLDDNRIINNLKIIKLKITNDKKPKDRWHIYYVLISKNQIKNIQAHLKNKWYAHFWSRDKIIVLFKSKKFILNAKNKATWVDAIKYGISIGIPEEQLDFLIEF